MTNGDRRNVWTREQVIQEMQHMALMEGTEPYVPEIRRTASADVKAIQQAAKRMFGTWAKAAEAAGLKVRE